MLTKKNGNFLVRFDKRIRSIFLREDNKWTIDSSSKPSDMCMPEESSSLANNGEVVHIALATLNGTLCDI